MNKLYLIISFIYNPFIVVFIFKILFERHLEGRIDVFMLLVFLPIIFVSLLSLFKISKVYNIANKIFISRNDIIDDFEHNEVKPELSKL